MSKNIKRKTGAPPEVPANVVKKTKIVSAGPTDVLSVISPELLTVKSRAHLRKVHDSAEPYTHLVLKSLCRREHMVRVHEEIVHNMDGNLKETDLYKLYQTTEMSRIISEHEQNRLLLGHLLQLRDAIYSKEFRSFIEEVTGCGELIDRTDLACNAYSGGCHLLCHDDVIGTRCVSFIIYITDPDTEWTAADGGGLELFPLNQEQEQEQEQCQSAGSDEVEAKKRQKQKQKQKQTQRQGVPASVPSVTILPEFNTMALFVVQPG